MAASIDLTHSTSAGSYASLLLPLFIILNQVLFGLFEWKQWEFALSVVEGTYSNKWKSCSRFQDFIFFFILILYVAFQTLCNKHIILLFQVEQRSGWYSNIYCFALVFALNVANELFILK